MKIVALGTSSYLGGYVRSYYKNNLIIKFSSFLSACFESSKINEIYGEYYKNNGINNWHISFKNQFHNIEYIVIK